MRNLLISDKIVTLMGVGDISLHMRDHAESWFTLVTPVLKSADLVVGQLETPCTTRSTITAPWGVFGHPHGFPLGRDPKNLDALRSAGFNVIHLAGNKIWDAGVPGIEDTINGLRNLGIAAIGAGMNIDEAREPAILECKGTRIGFLSYNCVGPKVTWANPIKPGCAWVRIVTAYEMDHPTPGGNPTIYTFAEPDSLRAMSDDIHKLRALCDVVVVHFHKGIGMTQIKLAMYEQPVSYAAIDAGADLILADHTHILRGIEQYKGKTIFHGLGSFIESPTPPVQRSDWVIQQKNKIFEESFGYDLSESQLFPEVPNSNLTSIAKCIVEG
jgi:poly-gamma-glutamate synthesis protein (capsule biosynthesis protein)